MNEYIKTNTLTIDKQCLKEVLKLIWLKNLIEWGICLRWVEENWWMMINDEGLSDKANNKVWEQLSKYLVFIYVHKTFINI